MLNMRLGFSKPILINKSILHLLVCRNTTQACEKPNYWNKNVPSIISSWQLRDFCGIDGLELCESVKCPRLNQPDDVLIEVKATSVNKLDVFMTRGYGNKLFEAANYLDIRHKIDRNLPLTLGRDFSGIIRAVGGSVKHLFPGHHVMGVIPPFYNGCHSQFTVAKCSNVVTKPDNISFEEAASLPYAGLTAWSALRITGELSVNSARKQILVLGASGGIGIIAVQLLKIWNATVFATCPADAVDLVNSLGADVVIDYTSDIERALQGFDRFDLILDLTGNCNLSYVSLLKPWVNAKYVTLSPPLLHNIDSYGIIGGSIKSGLDLFASNTTALKQGKTVRWAFFIPNKKALNEIQSYASKNQLKPVIDTIFSYNEVPDAYQKVDNGNLRGKVIISMEK